MNLKRIRHLAPPLLIAGVLLLVLLTACQSSPPPVDAARIAAGGGSVRSEGAPAWIDRFPDDPEYYVGVGSSSTGDKSADMEQARGKAIANMAASISTQIRSELTIQSREDSSGNREDEAESIINETVNQNLKEIEIVDSFHDDDIGYWFYVRLNKAKWAAIQKAEMDQLENRVLSLVAPALENTSVPIARKLDVLWKGWGLVIASPYMGLIQTQLGGQSGVLVDLIERQMTTLIDSLAIDFSPGSLTAQAGLPAMLKVAVSSLQTAPPGVFHINLAYKDNPGNIITTLVTEQDGVYDGEVDLRDLPSGTTLLVGFIDFGESGLDLSRIPRQISAIERDLAVAIEQIKAGLLVDAPDYVEVQNVFNTFKALLSSRLPLKIGSPSSEDRYLIRVTVQFREAPKNDFDMYIVFSKVFVAVEKGARTLFSYETAELKDGGLTAEQGQTRSFKKLIKFLEEDSSFSEELTQALSLE